MHKVTLWGTYHDSTTGLDKDYPISINDDGSINISGGSGGGAVSLLATDTGLVALATALAGVSPKTLADLYTLATSGSGFKIGTLPNITIQNTAFKVTDSAGTYQLAIDSNGKIGINNTSFAVTNTGLSNIDTAINALFTTTGIKVASLPAISDAVLTAVKDQTTDYLATKDVGKIPITGALQSAATGTGVGTPFTVTGMKMVGLAVTSTVVGAITFDFEVSVDGTNYAGGATPTGALVTDHQGIDNIGSITQTGAGTWVYQIMCAGITKIQCNITANAATGGTSVTVTGQALA